jgi:hypothetical protein
MKAVALLLVLGLAGACDLVPRFGGAWVHDTALELGDVGGTTMRLVLGQYGPEVAGHLVLTELTTCPCVYVKGTIEGDTVRFEPVDTTGCTPFFKRGEFDLSSDILRGTLSKLLSPGTDLAPLTAQPFELAREREQTDLGADDLRGCEGE